VGGGFLDSPIEESELVFRVNVLAPIVLGILQRMKGTFGFRRRGAT